MEDKETMRMYVCQQRLEVKQKMKMFVILEWLVLFFFFFLTDTPLVFSINNE